jgi:hypothetical protein
MTPELVVIVKKILDRNLLNTQSPKEISRVFRAYTKNDQGLLDEVIVLGLQKASHSPLVDEEEEERQEVKRQTVRENKAFRNEYAKKHNIDPTRIASHMWNEISKEIQETYEIASHVKNIVELLDMLFVNGKALGECTKTDLTMAYKQAKVVSVGAEEHAALYAKLAAVLKSDNETVRTGDRKKVLEVLKSLR